MCRRTLLLECPCRSADLISEHRTRRSAPSEGHAPVLAALETDQTTIPSAIFYEADGAVLIGRKAIEAYVEGAPGRLMRSLKSVLGTSLIEETTRLGRERDQFSRRHRLLSRRGETARRTGVGTRTARRGAWPAGALRRQRRRTPTPRRSRPCARSRARSAFDEVTFQFEPIAAALDYERQISAEEIALIADIGGGTSDFSIVRLSDPSATAGPIALPTFSPMTACASAAPISTASSASAS